jgi:hypothetical protein
VERPEPVFTIGQHVRVTLSGRNRTPHEGTIREIIWHHKDGCYNRYLEEAGKKVSERYFDFDLEAVKLRLIKRQNRPRHRL